MAKAILKMAKEAREAGLGFADLMQLLRTSFPDATRDEIEQAVADMLRGK